MDGKLTPKRFLDELFEVRPKTFFRQVDDCNRGLFMIMRMLFDAEQPVLAGEISEKLELSTARVATALKTLESRGNIVRHAAESDRRKVEVSLTEQGKKALSRATDELFSLIGFMIEQVGEKDIWEFLRITGEMTDALDRAATEK